LKFLTRKGDSESEHDLRSRMNNLALKKKEKKKFSLDWESNPDLCDERMQRSIP